MIARDKVLEARELETPDLRRGRRSAMGFPIDLTRFEPLVLDPAAPRLTDGQRDTLARNIQICR
ncbi:MAG: hypothetical protein ACYS6Z_18140, partial [Planctomycetota bacterium]